MEIFYVEDNRADVSLLKSALKISGCAPTLTVVDDGVQAIESLEKRQQEQQAFPALILLDLNLPKMNGYDVLNHLKQKKEWSSIPIITFTGSTNPEDKIRCLKMKVNDHWQKPQDLPQALEIAERLKSLLAPADSEN